MRDTSKISTKDILDKYSRKLESDLGSSSLEQEDYSKEYEKFKAELITEPSKYEKWAKSLGNFIKLKVSEKDKAKIQNYLDTAHADVTPSQALTLSIMSMLGVFFLTLLSAVSIYLITGTVQILFIFLGLIASMFVFYYSYTMPKRLANAWR